MSETSDLDAQMARRLFGWTHGQDAPTWGGPWHNPEGIESWDLPAYTTDPAATAQVWQWLETQAHELWDISVIYDDKTRLLCRLHCGTFEADGTGATWPEALCRAALALAEALERGGER